MTGYGDARPQDDRLDVAVELRTVNNRFLKISTRSPEACHAAKPPSRSSTCASPAQRSTHQPRAAVRHSHDSTVRYEFKRIFADHRNLSHLLGLITVAAILPQLMGAFPGRFRSAVVAREAERELMDQVSARWPARARSRLEEAAQVYDDAAAIVS